MLDFLMRLFDTSDFPPRWYCGNWTDGHGWLHILSDIAIWGAYTVHLLIRNPDELSTTENHPSWTHMYLMMMAAQVGFAVAYLIPK